MEAEVLALVVKVDGDNILVLALDNLDIPDQIEGCLVGSVL